MRSSLCFGVISAGTVVPKWQARCLRALMSMEGVQLVLRIDLGDGYGVRTDGVLTRALRRRLLAEGTGSMAPVDLTSELAHVPVLRMHGESVHRDTLVDDGSVLRGHELDFAILFSGDLKRNSVLVSTPRYGVWCFQHGLGNMCENSPPGFWEIYSGNRVTEVVLGRLGDCEGHFSVLRRGFFRTVEDSYEQNRDALLEAAALWPVHVCREILRGKTFDLDDPFFMSTPIRRRCPTAFQTLAFSLVVLRNRVAGKLQEMFRSEQWNIGVVERPLNDFLKGGPCTDIKWLPTPARHRYFADPFGYANGSRLTVLVEDYDYREEKGCISAVEFDGEWSSPKQVIIRRKHLSYPYLIRDGARIYCIPETHQSREVVLLEADPFPTNWKRVGTLVKDFAAADATVFQHEGRWWLLCTDVDMGSSTTLHAWYAPSLFGPWTPHLGNPIKIDVRSSRPAGTPFVHGGALFRPAQDCSKSYGGAVVINRVDRLTPDDFVEQPVALVEPDAKGAFPSGLHTLASVGEMTLIDGKRMVLVPEVFFSSLRGLARRLLPGESD